MTRTVRAGVATLVVTALWLVVGVMPALAAAPKVSVFSPTSGAVGAKVTISGGSFTGAKSVKFNGVAATFKVVSSTKISAVVPAAATTGKISVTTAGGTGTSVAVFSVSPLVKTIAPASGVAGSTVTITGATFTGATVVKFNGVAATFSVLSSTQISATVPATATTGKVMVTTPSGSGFSATNFTVGPAITNVAPNNGTVGSSVVITGTTFNGASAVSFNGSAASFVVNSATQITAVVPAAATTGKISVTTPSGNALSAVSFTVTPTITGFSPSLGPVGTTVTITGTTFNGASVVTFNGAAAFFTLVSPTQISATVPATATTGQIQVTTPGGIATSAGTFAVTPVINSFLPTSGPVGTSVVIGGTTFVGVTAVYFNGQPATYTVNSASQITATVPPTTTGAIEVVTTSGIAQSATSFTVTPSVVLSPTVGNPGSTLTVNGYGFDTGQLVDVIFDNTQVAFSGTDQTGSFTGTTIQVPTTAAPGAHTVTLIERVNGKWARSTFTVRTDWAQFHGGPRHTGYNAFENVIGTSNVSALDQAWFAGTGGTVQSSASVVGGVIYVGSSDGKLYTFDATTGTAGWSTNLGAAITGTPAVIAGSVYIGAANGNLYSLNASTGAIQWTATPGGTLTSPVVDSSTVYVGSSSGVMNAYDAATGNPIWSATIGSAVTTPAVANGLVYFGAANNRVQAIRTTNGTTAWTFTTTGGVNSTPAVSGGTVYIGSKDTNVYALNASTGTKIWNVATAGQVNSSPAIANGVVYIGSNDTTLYALSTADGSTIWNAGTATAAITGGVTVANGVVYYGSNDGNVYAADTTNGNTLWRAATGAAVVSTPTIINGTVYIGSNDTSLHAYH